MSKLHHQCPALVPTPEEALHFFTGKGCAVETKQLWFSITLVTTSQFHCWRKGNRGRSSNEAFHRHMVQLSLPYLARWLFTWRKAFFRQEQGAHTCLCKCGQHRTHSSEESPVQAGDLAQKLCRWACQLGTFGLTLLVPLIINLSSTKKRFVQIKSLNLFHILTYKGIFSHHFLQWNCKWLVTRILAITTTRSWTTISTLATVFLRGPGHFLSKQPPPQVL